MNAAPDLGGTASVLGIKSQLHVFSCACVFWGEGLWCKIWL